MAARWFFPIFCNQMIATTTIKKRIAKISSSSSSSSGNSISVAIFISVSYYVYGLNSNTKKNQLVSFFMILQLRFFMMEKKFLRKPMIHVGMKNENSFQIHSFIHWTKESMERKLCLLKLIYQDYVATHSFTLFLFWTGN